MADQERDDIELLRRQLAEEHRMASLGRLLAGVAHEINTPVGSILSNNQVVLRSLEMLKNDLERLSGETAAHARALVATLHSLAEVDKIACERIGAVVRGLKSFARADSDELHRVDVSEQVAGALKLMRGEYGRRIVFENLVPPDLPRVECYPGKLNQVLLNIIVNAAQAIEGAGKITITASADAGSAGAGSIDIRIHDTGKGIPESLRDRIFQSGYTSKPAGQGTGLGLTLSKRIIVDIHGGELDFESRPGEGSTFRIQLPLEQKRK